MKHHLKTFLIFAWLITACQTNSTFDQFDTNIVDLTKITGESVSPESFFDSALWSAALATALVAIISTSDSTYSNKSMDPTALDSEWIE